MLSRPAQHAFTILAAVSFLASCAPAAAPSVAPATSAPTVAASPTKASVTYAKIGTIDLPTQTASFDFMKVDPKSRTLYVADRTNKGVDVISLANEKFVTTIGGFIGLRKSDDSGPNGLELVPDLNQLWATDGDSTVKVIDLATKSVTASISTGGKRRSDDVAYDPKDKIVMVANDADGTPFVTFISATDRTVLGKLELPGAGGLEGILWDDARGVFWQAVPTSKANPGGEIVLIDPKAMKVTKTYPVKDCYPHGIAFGPRGQMLLGCSGDAIKAGAKAQTLVMDTANGGVVATIAEIGGADIVVYNAADDRYYLALSNMTSDGTKNGTDAPVLAIVDASTNKLLQTLPTKKSAHSVSVDPTTNHVYVPIPGEPIAIFGTR